MLVEEWYFYHHLLHLVRTGLNRGLSPTYTFQVLLAMHANVEDRGIKGDCTPLMEAASAGHVDIVRLLIAHGADVNAQSSSGTLFCGGCCCNSYC